MDNDNAFMLAKLALIETLLRGLYVEQFDRRREPILTAQRRAEEYGNIYSGFANSSIPPDVALRYDEMMNQFFDDVIAELRRRAEIRSQGK